MNTRKTPTTAAVATAVRNADRDAKNYDVEQWTPAYFMVQHKVETFRCYMVEVERGQAVECDCPAFAREGICKHMQIIDDELAAEELAALEAGRLEMEVYWAEARA